MKKNNKKKSLDGNQMLKRETFPSFCLVPNKMAINRQKIQLLESHGLFTIVRQQ